MLKVGLTGGIASGKTTVADCLAELGAAVIDTDVLAREVVAPGEPGLTEVVAEFGNDILQPDGTLDRARLRSLVFADKSRRQRLEAILHPLIRARTLQAVEAAEDSASPYVVIVVPLLVETDFATLVDRVLVVDISPELQRQRLMARDSVSAAEAAQIIGQQASREQRLKAADDVLENNADTAQLREQAARLHAHYLDLAGSRTGAKP